MTDVPEPTAVDASDRGVPPDGGVRPPGHPFGAPGASSAASGAVRPVERRGARIEVSKLGKSYIHGGKALPILWDIDLMLEPGAMVAVVGASGVGKSTFLQLLGTLDLPTSGSIKFDDEELTTMTASRLAEFRNRRIGFVFQFHHLLPEFTALDNVAMPLTIRRMGLAQARAAATAALQAVGLGARLAHHPSELSGGERQRTAIARAIVTAPACVLADEPTGNLDRDTASAVFDVFVDLSRQRHTAVVIVTHDPELAARCDRTMRMSEGRLQPVT